MISRNLTRRLLHGVRTLNAELVKPTSLPLRVSRRDDPYSLIRESVPYVGSVVRNTPKSVVMKTDSEDSFELPETFVEFKSEDILKVESMAIRANINGSGAVQMSKFWVKKGSVGKQWSSFIVE